LHTTFLLKKTKTGHHRDRVVQSTHSLRPFKMSAFIFSQINSDFALRREGLHRNAE